MPAVYPVILAFQAQEAANGDVPAAAWQQAHGGVHGEHDLVSHRPLIPGESLQTWSRLCAVRTTRAGTQVVLHIEQFGADGGLAVEQWWTTVLLGLHTLADPGSMPNEHRFPTRPETNRSGPRPITSTSTRPAATPRCRATGRPTTSTATPRGRPGSTSCSPTACAPWRCARIASWIWSASTTPAVRRVAVRFASPTPLGADLTVTAYGINTHSFAFEAACKYATVVTHGRLELRS